MPLADGDFKWEKGKLLSVDYIMQNYMNWSDDDERGMIFEADWIYPDHLVKNELQMIKLTLTDSFLA